MCVMVWMRLVWAVWVMLWAELLITPTYARVHHPPGVDPLALLAGTLRTFQRHACDSTTLALSCPSNTTIDITLARYGRPRHAHMTGSATGGGGAGAVDPCPPLPHHSPLNHKTVCQYPKGVDYDTLQLVVASCQHKQQCSINVDPATFANTDPCPLTRKYIEVAYKCRPETFINKVVCVSGELTLTCPKDARLAIYSVLFGRSQAGSYTCPQPEGVPEEDCQASYANEIVMSLCHGRRECHLLASPEVFGNPCSSTSNMYMKTVYTCVPKKILKPPPSKEESGGKKEAGEGADEENEEEESIRGGYEEGSLRSPPAPPPSDPHYTPSTAFYNPTITTRLADKSSEDSEVGIGASGGDVVNAGGGSSQYPQDESSRAQTELINCTVTILSGSEDREIGYLTEWMQAVAFVKSNFEKFLLYLLLGVCVGLVLFLVVVVTQLLWDRRRARKEAKMMHDPLTSVFAADIDDIDGDLDLDGGLGGGSLGRSPSPPQDPTREVVRYNTCRGVSGGGLRRQDSDTNPRSLSRNNNNQLFYS